jgi:uncharacterized protein YjbI with pentapeptide repeats
MKNVLRNDQIESELDKAKKKANYQIHYNFFNGIIVENYDFYNIDLGLCIINKSEFNNCRFINVGMSTHMVDTVITNSIIENADFHKTELGGVQVHKSIFIKSSFSRANIISALITDSQFRECNFSGCIFSDNKIINTKFVNHKGVFRTFHDNEEKDTYWSEKPENLIKKEKK